MKDPDDPADGAALFRRAVAGTRRLTQDRLGPFRASRPVAPSQRLRDNAEVVASLLHDGPDLAEIETGEELLFVRPGIQQRLWRKFRRGHYSIEGELDLHGRTVDEARTDLELFLRHSRQAGHRCVRIIHGKGHRSPGRIPVLKTRVNYWLRQRAEVLAFASARTADGGTGALYVLLAKAGPGAG